MRISRWRAERSEAKPVVCMRVLCRALTYENEELK